MLGMLDPDLLALSAPRDTQGLLGALGPQCLHSGLPPGWQGLVGLSVSPARLQLLMGLGPSFGLGT